MTLNDPVYVEAAQSFARLIVREGGDDVRSRARYGLERSLLRDVDEARIDVIEELFWAELEAFSEDSESALEVATDPLGPLSADEDAAELAAWTVVANVLLNQDAILVRE